MRKILIAMFLVSSLSLSSLVAAEMGVQNTKAIQSNTLSKADSEKLFGINAQDVKVAQLSEEEMKETKGEFWLETATILSGIVAGFELADRVKGWFD